jgi:hypothetical protein
MKRPDRNYIINLWLKYHNTNVQEVQEKHTLEELSNAKWFDYYEVTQEQYDEWVNATKDYLKTFRYSKKRIETEIPWIIIDISPKIKKII